MTKRTVNKRSVGKKYEKLVVDMLTNEGYTILECNFCCKFGEIDIIALNSEALVFAEVKYRKGISSGFPEEAVDRRKQRKISLCADYYCMRHGFYDDTDIRFDVIAVDGEHIRHYKNAFLYCGNNY